MQPSDGVRGKSEESLNRASSLPKVEVMRGRLIIGLALAVAGICFGVLGTILSIDALTILAGVLAIAACVSVGGATFLPLLQKTDNNDLSDRIDAVTRSGEPEAMTTTGADDEESVIDPITELPDARFFEVAVEGRVAAARRHLWPVSIVLLQLGFDSEGTGQADRDRSLQSFANLMRQTLREADIACRINDNTFGLILEDTSEEGGVWTAERLQIALSHDATSIRRLVAGVAAYPTHGLFSKDVLVRAQAALHRASATPAGHGLGQVEVAHVDLS